MISKSKLGMIAFIATMGIASPAFASTMETGTAANTFGYDSPQANQIGAVSGPRLFDAVPQAPAGSNLSSLTGGGSVGYDSHNTTAF